MELELYIVTLAYGGGCDVLGVFNDYAKAITLQRARQEQVKESGGAGVSIQIHEVKTNYYLSLQTR